MSTPAAKRRRVEAASSTLQKPFRSPFKTPFKSPVINKAKAASASASASDNSNGIAPAEAAHSASTITPRTARSTRKSGNTTTFAPTPLGPKPTNTNTYTPSSRAKKSFTSPASTAALNADPDIAPLLKVQRELEKQLKEVKEELEIAEQARKIERDSERKGDGNGVVDGELEVLVGKWRGASRMAAEELFGRVRDRVNRMGGPRAWKEMQKRQQQFQNSWEQEEPPNNNDDDEDEDEERKDAEKRDVYAEYDIDPETENEKAQRARGVGDTGENPGEEDEFTMAMMLRTLNVDLEVIGYDRVQQRWID